MRDEPVQKQSEHLVLADSMSKEILNFNPEQQKEMHMRIRHIIAENMQSMIDRAKKDLEHLTIIFDTFKFNPK